MFVFGSWFLSDIYGIRRDYGCQKYDVEGEYFELLGFVFVSLKLKFEF